MNAFAVVLFLLFMAAAVPAGQDVAINTASAEIPAVPTATPSTYLIGPQDVLKVTVFDEPDLSQSYRVDLDGMITFPLIGRMPAGGHTLSEFQDRLRDQLANGFIRNPQVRVEVEQYKSQSVFVLGEVRTPGRISMTGSKTLLEALAEAGSPTSAANSAITITHPRKASTGSAAVNGAASEEDKSIVDLRDLQSAQNYILHDGDIVTVPKAQSFFIGGEVRTNGNFIYQPDMTLAQAVTLAGGLTERGTYRGAYATRIVKGKPVKVDLNEQDKIKPEDTIRIGRRIF
jgi:polysaccharide export outer membrane protein